MCMEEVELEIQSLAATGAGVGTVEEKGMKRPVFVYYTVPGDIVRVRITKQHKKYYEAELIEIVKESKSRIKPVCKHFGECGACDWLHIRYGEQIKAKEQLLRLFFKRNSIELGKIEIIKADKTLNYRDKIRVDGESRYCFYARASNKTVPIERCYIINDELNRIFGLKPDKKGEKSFAYDYKTKNIVKEGEKAYYYFEDIKFAYLTGSFAQSNTEMNRRLIKEVFGEAEGKDILELYAGNGNFTIPLSRKSEKITAVEGDKNSYEMLKYNMKENRSANISAYRDDVRWFLKKNSGKMWGCIIIDPPRTGAGDIIEQIAKATEKIIYVSCNAQELARDVKKIIPLGYEIKKVKLIDMFPQTRHFETLLVLNRKAF